MSTPPPYLTRSYGGGAEPAQLVEPMGVSDTTFAITTTVGWTENSGNPLGTSGNFIVIIDRFSDTVEKIECSAVNLTTGVVTVYAISGYNGRGYDGTTPQAHVPGTTPSGVQTTWSSVEAMEANQAVTYLLGSAGGTPSVGQVLGWSGTAPFWGTQSVPTGAWTAYTPGWESSGTQPTLGNGTLTGAYQKLGRIVTVRIEWIYGSTTSFGTGTYAFTLPFAGVTGISQSLSMFFTDATDNWAATGFIQAGSETGVLLYSTKGGTSGSVIGIAASGSSAIGPGAITINGVYESET